MTETSARDLRPGLGPGVEVGADGAATVEALLGRRVPVPDVLEVGLVGRVEQVAVAGGLLLGLVAAGLADRRLAEVDGDVGVGRAAR